MNARASLPVEVDDLTAQWFSEVFDREVAEATVLDRSTGTTGRARVALQGEDGTPANVFVKLPPFGEKQRALVDMTGMGVTEARFYRDLSHEVAVRTPGVWFAETDGDRYVMVLEDLAVTGCRFPSPADPDVEARARDIVEQLAALHAPYWESERFAPDGDLAWVAARSVRVSGAIPYIKRAVEALGDLMDETFHVLAGLYLSRSDDIMQLFGAGAGTLVHGDAHIGNLFVDVSEDRTGFLDWAVVCQAPGMRDVAYAMCNSVPRRVREAIEHGIVERYCEQLANSGSCSILRSRGTSTGSSRCSHGRRPPQPPASDRNGSRSSTASRGPGARLPRAPTSTAWVCSSNSSVEGDQRP